MDETKILAVVVLYKRLPGASQTLCSLAALFAKIPSLLQSVQVLVWDNSPSAINTADLQIPCHYRHSDGNVGTSGAYNNAMQFAEDRGIPWMLLLDQDTTLTEEFVLGLLGYSHRLRDAAEVGSVVPFVYSHGKLVSPRLLLSFNRNHQIPPGFDGVCRQRSYAVNSSSLVRVAALREIGGYSDEFWLDLSDVYAFQQMYFRKRYMYVAGDLVLQHSLSGMDYDREMTVERYRNFLAAESAFVDLYSSPIERIAQLYRLLMRTWIQYRRFQNKMFARLAWQYFLQRLFHRREARLRGWRQQMTKRDLPMMLDGKLVH